MARTRTERAERPSLPATVSRVRPGCFPLGSPQSRAAARSLVAERKASEPDELRLEVRSIVDGKRVDLRACGSAQRGAIEA